MTFKVQRWYISVFAKLWNTLMYFTVWTWLTMERKTVWKLLLLRPRGFKSTQTGVFRIFIAFVQKGTKKVLTQFTNESKSI